MNLLSIDTASSIFSVAVGIGAETYYTETEAGVRHSEDAMVLIDEQMKKASLKPEDLNGVLCMGGPGSFTGLRIAYSIAKGLALSLSIPFASVPTFDCVSFNTSGLVLTAIEARKNSWYYAIYRDNVLQSGIKEGGIEQINAENIRVIYKTRGYAKELLEIGKTLDFSDTGALFSGPEYFRDVVSG